MVAKHGDYRLSDGSRATVVHVSRHAAFGFDSHGNARAWRQSNGKAIRMYDLDVNVFDITGPWIDEPDPGEGWRLLKDDECIRNGDEYWRETAQQWERVSTNAVTVGMRPQEVAKRFPERAAGRPIYRRRIEKPFTISEHGCGVYETRDGNEQRIAQHRPGGGMLTGPSFVWVSETLNTYRDDGRYIGDKEDAKDLVRYLRPLDEPHHEWKPTCELQRREVPYGTLGATMFSDGNGITDGWTWKWFIVEQKWTCGEKTEWRPVEVQQ